MAGAGTHLHAVIREYTGDDYKPGCGCRALVNKMDSNPPNWSREHVGEILAKMRAEARARHWWARIVLKIPGSNRPILWMIQEAIRRAEADLA